MNKKTATCPNCIKDCHKVSDTTMRHHLRFPASMKDLSEAHYYCKNRDCHIAYFSHTNQYSVTHLQTAGQIQQQTICFCFGITESMFNEYQQQGTEDTFFKELDYLAYSSECFCRIKNPAGRGCLKTFKSLSMS